MIARHGDGEHDSPRPVGTSHAGNAQLGWEKEIMKMIPISPPPLQVSASLTQTSSSSLSLPPIFRTRRVSGLQKVRIADIIHSGLRILWPYILRTPGTCGEPDSPLSSIQVYHVHLLFLSQLISRSAKQQPSPGMGWKLQRMISKLTRRCMPNSSTGRIDFPARGVYVRIIKHGQLLELVSLFNFEMFG